MSAITSSDGHKRRRRNPLARNYLDDRHQPRYSAPLYSHYLQGPGAKKSPTKKRREASAANVRNVRRKDKASAVVVPAIIVSANKDNIKNQKHIYQSRKQGIRYFFKLYGSPPREDWKECRIIPLIMEKMHIPPHSYRCVLRTLERIENLESEAAFDPTGCQKLSSGAKSIIQENDSTAHVIYASVTQSMSDTNITFLVNEHRTSHGLPKVCRKTVLNFIAKTPLIESSARESSKQGSTDENSVWAKARMVFAEQLKEELRLGMLKYDHRDVRMSEFKQLSLYGFGSWDEKYLRQQVGQHSAVERRVYQDASGNVTLEGGTLAPKQKKVNLKYCQEARGLFGCCLVKQRNGDIVAKQFKVFNYSQRVVIGFKRYEAEIKAELLNKQRTKVKVDTVWTRGVGGYKGRYGDNWRK